MEQCIVYTRPTGGQAVVFPILSPGQTVEEVAPRLVPAGIDYVITTRQPTPDHFWIDGQWVIPENPPVDHDILASERDLMKLSFSQFVVGLTEQGWITEEEAGAWLSANALPAAVEAAIATLPETAEDGSKPRLRARARALRPTEIERTNELLLMMAAMQGASAEQLDQFFRKYAGV